MKTSERRGAVVGIVLIALAFTVVAVNGQTPAASAPSRADLGETIQSASRRAGKALTEMVVKSTALTDKKLFKGFRWGSCQPAIFAAPAINTPLKSLPALALCQS